MSEKTTSECVNEASVSVSQRISSNERKEETSVEKGAKACTIILINHCLRNCIYIVWCKRSATFLSTRLFNTEVDSHVTIMRMKK